VGRGHVTFAAEFRADQAAGGFFGENDRVPLIFGEDAITVAGQLVGGLKQADMMRSPALLPVTSVA